MFHASEDSLDDLMRAVFRQLLNGRGNFQVESSKGKSTEIFGAILELKNPRARLSRSFSRAKAFSPLGELFWYISGSDEVSFIEHYIQNYGNLIKDKVKANGAYGPRIFGPYAEDRRNLRSHWDRVIRTLREREGSRNALIQIYENSDAKPNNHDKPCTCTLQFAIRNGQLLLHAHMRSNDAFWGLPHDIFSFTMLQEIAARELGVGLGKYTHSVTSLHLYHNRPAKGDDPGTKSTSQARAYFGEDLHEFVPMPEMPVGDPWGGIQAVSDAEREIRLGNVDWPLPSGLDQYWTDLIGLFRIHKIFEDIRRLKPSKTDEMQKLRKAISIMLSISPIYGIYVRDRLDKKAAPIRDLFELAEKGSSL